MVSLQIVCSRWISNNTFLISTSYNWCIFPFYILQHENKVFKLGIDTHGIFGVLCKIYYYWSSQYYSYHDSRLEQSRDNSLLFVLDKVKCVCMWHPCSVAILYAAKSWEYTRFALTWNCVVVFGKVLVSYFLITNARYDRGKYWLGTKQVTSHYLNQ